MYMDVFNRAAVAYSELLAEHAHIIFVEVDILLGNVKAILEEELDLVDLLRFVLIGQVEHIGDIRLHGVHELNEFELNEVEEYEREQDKAFHERRIRLVGHPELLVALEHRRFVAPLRS